MYPTMADHNHGNNKMFNICLIAYRRQILANIPVEVNFVVCARKYYFDDDLNVPGMMVVLAIYLVN